MPRAAAGARSCCMRTSDWDCGCRVEVSRVVSAGAAGACNEAPARRMARRRRGPARRRVGVCVELGVGDPNLLLLIAEVRTLPTGHSASCRTAPLEAPLHRGTAVALRNDTDHRPRVPRHLRWYGVVRRKLATATILNRQYIIQSFQHPGARALSSTPCQLQCSTLPPSFFRSCYVSTHME